MITEDEEDRECMAWKKEVGSGDRQGRSGDVETREGRDIRRKVVRVGTMHAMEAMMGKDLRRE